MAGNIKCILNEKEGEVERERMAAPLPSPTQSRFSASNSKAASQNLKGVKEAPDLALGFLREG